MSYMLFGFSLRNLKKREAKWDAELRVRSSRYLFKTAITLHKTVGDSSVLKCGNWTPFTLAKEPANAETSCPKEDVSNQESPAPWQKESSNAYLKEAGSLLPLESHTSN